MNCPRLLDRISYCLTGGGSMMPNMTALYVYSNFWRKLHLRPVSPLLINEINCTCRRNPLP